MSWTKRAYLGGRYLYRAKASVLVVLASLALPLAGLRAHEQSLPKLPQELEAVRANLEKYQDPVTAVREGYWSTLGCVVYPDGNMGVHFVNGGLIGPVPDPMAPQILLYEPADGKLRLVGAEWFIPLATGVKERPELFGRPFEGPMEGHYPLLPLELHHYDLHVWLFKENPAGLFSHSNPDVNCDGQWGYPVVAEEAKTVPVE